MKSKRRLPLLKIIIIAALAFSAGYVAFVVPDAVESFMPAVDTIKAESLEYKPTVSAKGAIVSRGEQWMAVVAVNEGDISAVEIGQSVQLSGAALPDGIYRGSVISIADTAYTQQTAAAPEIVVDVTVEIEEGDFSMLRSGYSVTAQLKTGEERFVKMLPYSVIRQDEKGEYVYILQNGSSVRRDIVTGIELADKTEVVSGIFEGDMIICDPEAVSDGGKVRLK